MNKIIYLDAAASSLKPQTVIDAELQFLTRDYSNAGRGICARAAATDNMLATTRRRVADFIGAASDDQVIFTAGTTDAMNRIARMVFENIDGITSVAVSDLDHHSARMPWEYQAGRMGANIVLLPFDAAWNIIPHAVPAADVVVITAMSNVLGWPQDVEAIVAAARAANPNVITVVDGAQYVAHEKIEGQAWDCAFMAFSGH